MKRFLTLCSLLGAILLGGVSCVDENKQDVPTAEVSVVSTDANSVEILLRTTSISEYAYLVYKDGEESSSDENILFASGTTGTCTDGENTVTVTGLEPMTKYEVVFGFKTAGGGFLGNTAGAEFTTKDYTEDLTLVSTTPDGFSVHVKMPQSVLDNEHVLRYSAGNLVMYNFNKGGWMAALDASMLEANGGNYLEGSSTITFNKDNILARDEDGNIIVDEWGNETQLHDPFVPGEPVVFMAGEFGWGESSFGWGEGWYSPMFDTDAFYEAFDGGGSVNEDDFWTGHFKRLTFTTSQPAVLDAKLNISHEAQATSGILRINPDAEIFQYCVLLMDNATYEGMVLPLLDNEEKYMQWFTTSYFAMMQLGAQTLSGAREIALEDYYYIEPDVEYHAFVTGMSDKTGTTQCFEHYTFTTPEKTGTAPEIEVTQIANPDGEESPWEIWFNVKSPSKNVKYAKYAANYERDWETALKYNSYSTIVSQGFSFSDAEVAEINSDAGFNMMFSSRDDATTRLAVLGYNSEDTPNDIDTEGSKAIAEAALSGSLMQRKSIPSSSKTFLESGQHRTRWKNTTATASHT